MKQEKRRKLYLGRDKKRRTKGRQNRDRHRLEKKINNNTKNESAIESEKVEIGPDIEL